MSQYTSSDFAETYTKLLKNSSSSDGAVEFLRFCRSSGVGDTTHISKICNFLRKSKGTSLADEYWLILEQGTIASLLIGDIDEAKVCEKILEDRFGAESGRILRIKAMILEAEGKSDSAKTLISKSQETHDTNSALLKREIAINIGKKDFVNAALKYQKFLDTFCSDTDAWLGLAELYLEQSPRGSRENQLPQAIFCYEELVLLQPNNISYLTRLAELRIQLVVEYPGLISSTSSAENELRLARLSAAEAVRLSEKKNAYALAALADASFGLFCVAQKLPFFSTVINGEKTFLKVLAGGPLSSLPSRIEKLPSSYIRIQESDIAKENASPNSLTTECEDLHALAVHHLRLLESSSFNNRKLLEESITVHGHTSKPIDVFPAIKIEKAILSERSFSIFESQTSFMELLGVD